jgi:DNA-binding XRE family transcriptional regulator
MSEHHVPWEDVKRKARAMDPRTDAEREGGRSRAREATEAYVRGYQLSEMRRAAGITQAELARALGVTQARISKIEHGDISGVDVIRAYVTALGGTIELVATVGDRTWRVA